jgi:hypothetical protein
MPDATIFLLGREVVRDEVVVPVTGIPFDIAHHSSTCASKGIYDAGMVRVKNLRAKTLGVVVRNPK